MINRIIFSDNGSVTDWSLELNRFDSGQVTFSFVSAEDYIFIGSIMPFNSFYVNVGTTANAASSAIGIATWDGTQFRNAEDIIDQTSTLGTSGIIKFTPDRERVWQREHTNYGGQTVTGLSSFKIYDHYWARISFTNNLTNSVNIKFIGQRFCDDTDLGSEYPMLNRQVVRNAFSSNLANFNEQAIRASDYVIQDLRRSNIIWHPGMILDTSELKLATVHKLAEIIFNALGDDYNDQRDDARVQYKKTLNTNFLTVDKDQNAIADLAEMGTKSGWMYR